MIPIQHVDPNLQIGKVRDDLACILSLFPGLGHLYKGYYGGGLFLLLLALPTVIFVSLLLGMATLGFSLFMPVVFWISVMAHAYFAPDHRRHHWRGL